MFLKSPLFWRGVGNLHIAIGFVVLSKRYFDTAVANLEFAQHDYQQYLDNKAA